MTYAGGSAGSMGARGTGWGWAAWKAEGQRRLVGEDTVREAEPCTLYFASR